MSFMHLGRAARGVLGSCSVRVRARQLDELRPRARDLAEAQLSIVRKKLAELRELEHSLAKFAADCTEQCAGGPSKDCVILEDFTGKATCCARKPA